MVAITSKGLKATGEKTSYYSATYGFHPTGPYDDHVVSGPPISHIDALVVVLISLLLLLSIHFYFPHSRVAFRVCLLTFVMFCQN